MFRARTTVGSARRRGRRHPCSARSGLSTRMYSPSSRAVAWQNATGPSPFTSSVTSAGEAGQQVAVVTAQPRRAPLEPVRRRVGVQPGDHEVAVEGVDQPPVGVAADPPGGVAESRPPAGRGSAQASGRRRGRRSGREQGRGPPARHRRTKHPERAATIVEYRRARQRASCLRTRPGCLPFNLYLQLPEMASAFTLAPAHCQQRSRRLVKTVLTMRPPVFRSV